MRSGGRLLVGIGFALGALTYDVGDRVIDQSDGADRQSIDALSKGGSGAAIVFGALLGSIPGRSFSAPRWRSVGA